MLYLKLKFGRALLLALFVAATSACCLPDAVFAAGTVVRPKNLRYEDSQWASAEAKQRSGRYDDSVQKGGKDPAESSDDSTVNAVPGDGSTSERSSHWVWAILASLLVAGGGLTGFGYYWSNSRRVASW